MKRERAASRRGDAIETPGAAIYSPAIGALGVFVGGPFAAVALAALNARHLQRLAMDRVWLGGAALLSGGTVFGAAWLALRFQEREVAYRERFYWVVPVVGLSLWGKFCARQRASATQASGGKNAVWGVKAVVVVVLAALLQLALNALATLSFGSHGPFWG